MYNTELYTVDSLISIFLIFITLPIQKNKARGYTRARTPAFL